MRGVHKSHTNGNPTVTCEIAIPAEVIKYPRLLIRRHMILVNGTEISRGSKQRGDGIPTPDGFTATSAD
jgi:hypothetical protein